MATKIRKHTDPSKAQRYKRKIRIRKKLSGTAERPRVSVFRSNQHFYAQVIDDIKAHTVLSVSTLEPELKDKVVKNKAGLAELGKILATRALAANIKQLVFDRSGYIYHGRVKAFADALRENGIQV